jgi:hypothetical protein
MAAGQQNDDKAFRQEAVRLPAGYVYVLWGDGSLSQYAYCFEVCYLYVTADHTYTTVGDYHPLVCLGNPLSGSSVNFPCTSVEIKVFAPPPPTK